MMLLTCYSAYVAFMAHNQTIERMVKNILNKKRIASSFDLAYIMQVFNIFKRKTFLSYTYKGWTKKVGHYV